MAIALPVIHKKGWKSLSLSSTRDDSPDKSRRKMAEAKRQAAEKRGRKGEWLAAVYLQAKGYRILGRRVRTPMGEVDLIAKRGRLVAFVEVKFRAEVQIAAGAVTSASWQRIARAAEFWMARHPALSDCGWRYDLIALAPRKLPQHIQDAWRPGLA
ncbi:YraN family protein [Hyphomonas sp.]|uniref:YraN family protein n=1 Tax=Hyphomonas sp. TaxID=87 RepID=UPI0025C57B45|nr:YraN family protein [Hyphomonas sp.]